MTHDVDDVYAHDGMLLLFLSLFPLLLLFLWNPRIRMKCLKKDLQPMLQMILILSLLRDDPDLHHLLPLPTDLINRISMLLLL